MTERRWRLSDGARIRHIVFDFLTGLVLFFGLLALAWVVADWASR